MTFFIALILIITYLLGSTNVSDHSSPVESLPGPSPSSPPQVDQSQTSQQHNKDDNFLPSPLCSSLLLELPPSPAVINPSQVIPAPPPPPICTSPLSHTGKSRKRRAPTLFDAADWLETLTSGLRPLTPPTAPFVESDFSLDSDLNVSRVLDLMIEQWWGLAQIYLWAYFFLFWHEWEELYASQWWDTIVINCFQPSPIGCQSQRLHATSRAGLAGSFDEATRA